MLLATLILWSPVAHAQEEGVPLNMDFNGRLVAGKDRPCLRLTAQGAIRKLKVVISRDGMRKKFGARRMAGGSSKRFCWKEKPGIYQYNLEMSCILSGKKRSSSTELALSYLPPLKMLLSKERINLEERSLTFQINHPADKVELVIRGKGGKVLLETGESYDGAAPGSQLSLSWDKVEGEIVRMDVKAYDTDG